MFRPAPGRNGLSTAYYAEDTPGVHSDYHDEVDVEVVQRCLDCRMPCALLSGRLVDRLHFARTGHAFTHPNDASRPGVLPSWISLCLLYETASFERIKSIFDDANTDADPPTIHLYVARESLDARLPACAGLCRADIEQGTDEWLDWRKTRATGSKFGAYLGSKFAAFLGDDAIERLTGVDPTGGQLGMMRLGPRQGGGALMYYNHEIDGGSTFTDDVLAIMAKGHVEEAHLRPTINKILSQLLGYEQDIRDGFCWEATEDMLGPGTLPGGWTPADVRALVGDSPDGVGLRFCLEIKRHENCMPTITYGRRPSTNASDPDFIALPTARSEEFYAMQRTYAWQCQWHMLHTGLPECVFVAVCPKTCMSAAYIVRFDPALIRTAMPWVLRAQDAFNRRLPGRERTPEEENDTKPTRCTTEYTPPPYAVQTRLQERIGRPELYERWGQLESQIEHSCRLRWRNEYSSETIWTRDGTQQTRLTRFFTPRSP